MKADAIVLVIDASDEMSYDSLFSNWMPSILKVSPSVLKMVVLIYRNQFLLLQTKWILLKEMSKITNWTKSSVVFFRNFWQVISVSNND